AAHGGDDLCGRDAPPQQAFDDEAAQLAGGSGNGDHGVERFWDSEIAGQGHGAPRPCPRDQDADSLTASTSRTIWTWWPTAGKPPGRSAPQVIPKSRRSIWVVAWKPTRWPFSIGIGPPSVASRAT